MSRAEQTAGVDEPWMLEDGDAQAARFNGVTPTATHELLFGAPRIASSQLLTRKRDDGSECSQTPTSLHLGRRCLS